MAQDHVGSCFPKSVQIAAEDGMALTPNSGDLLCDSLIGACRKLRVASVSIADASRTVKSANRMAVAVALLEPPPGAAAQPLLAPDPAQS